MTTWSMRIACWIPKATNTHSEYVMFIVLPLHQWLHEGICTLRYKYFACLVLSYVGLKYCERRLLASSCLSVRIAQLDCHKTYFHKILYLRIV